METKGTVARASSSVMAFPVVIRRDPHGRVVFASCGRSTLSVDQLAVDVVQDAEPPLSGAAPTRRAE